ncbi:MAG TPA: hypothetical protein VI913_05740 [Candidatus Peribacteraceae bacterium]|nr:hypothetical protein [Candidatus Peribacteraceae bacterium]
MSSIATITVRDRTEAGEVEARIKAASSYVDAVKQEGDQLRVEYYGMMHRYEDGRSDNNDAAVKADLEAAGFEVVDR